MVTFKQRISGIFGLYGIFLGALVICGYPYLYHAIFKSQMILEEGSIGYELWESSPNSVYFKLYYFNVTNSEDITARKPGVKPKLEECGPYVFREERQKVGVTFNDNDTISYRQVKTYHFVPELSKGSLEDEITTINVVALTAVEYARYNPEIFYVFAINSFLEEVNASLFMTYPVSNFTFDGIYDSILEGADSTSGIELPLPNDKFGWFYLRNNSADYDGWFSVHTGADDFSLLGQISEWNFSTIIRPDIYVDHCGMLNGSAGDLFPPFLEETYVDYFAPGLCRSIRFNFAEEVKINGVPAYKFKLDESLVANASTNEDNWCFNPRQDYNQDVPNGLLNISACKYNTPMYASYPHFYKADPFYLDQFEPGSVFPNQDLHESHMNIDSVSGVILDAKVRTQINVLLSPLNVTSEGGFSVSVELLDGLEPTFYPTIWFETTTEANDENSLRMQLFAILPKLGIIFGSIIMTLGFLTCLLALNSIWKEGTLKRKRGEEKKARWDYSAKGDHQHTSDEYYAKKGKI